MCQRYYHQIAIGSGNQTISVGFMYSSSQVGSSLSLPVSVRTNPTIVTSTGSSDFSFYRNGDLFECKNNKSLRKWFLKNQFKTLWNPTIEDIKN
mgnify:CR=1 FL=1